MPNAYVTPRDVLLYRSGLDLSTLIGNQVRLANPVNIGDTTITVAAPGLTVQLNQYDSLWIFDGPNTEMVSATAQKAVGQTVLSLSAAQYAHAAGVLVFSDGTAGSLSQDVVDACDELENICFQSRFLATYTETYSLPSMQVALAQDLSMLLRPAHFPVAAISSLSLAQYGISTSYGVDTVLIENNGKSIKIPALLPVGTVNSQLLQAPASPPAHSSNVTGDVTITYTAGYAVGALPGHVRKAAIFLACDGLSKWMNPQGAQEAQSGKRHFKLNTNMDSSGDSHWRKQAVQFLRNEVLRAW